IAAAATAALLLLAVRFVRAGLRRLAALHAAYRLAAVLPASGGELAVIDHPAQQAYAVPGHPGRIVVSTGVLRGLNAGERRAVLAHERAHLAHRHHLHHTVAHLAAAANPLLARLPDAVALSTERWADEKAAATCRRDIVADALTYAATVSTRVLATPAVVLAAGATDVAAPGARSIIGPYLGSLGATAAVVGLITGAGEAAALVLRLFTGRLSDRTGRPWPQTITGYALTAVCVPLIALTGNLVAAGLLYNGERVGKAVRTPARDTMLAHASAEIGRGYAFGLHEALDQIGAMTGP